MLYNLYQAFRGGGTLGYKKMKVEGHILFGKRKVPLHSLCLSLTLHHHGRHSIKLSNPK